MPPNTAVTAPFASASALMNASATSARESTTAVLTRGLAGGDEEAFRTFHEQYYARLLRYHLVLARGDEHSAREALQETLSRVAHHAKRFECAEAFWSWLTVLARCAAVDGGRRRARYWRLLKNYASGWMRPDPSPPPADEAILPDLLDQALLSLPRVDRELLEAKYSRGASVRELASETGLTEKAVESRLHRLRCRLREQLLTSLRHDRSR